ncbi:MAG: NAD(P)/FAD-dependent oxidoreductase [Aerococcus suis]|nr:NAD(P)/FAD-dependent oxidoreductase [Aerococcus suis]
MSKHYKVAIIGAGAAGIGMGCLLSQFNWNDFIILEQETIGNSFLHWPEYTHFITPSFTTNGFGFPDLNAIVPDTSPAYTFGKEHLSGKEYATYLKGVATYYELPIIEHSQVTLIKSQPTFYVIKTDQTTYTANYVIMATGEYGYPHMADIQGNHLARHYSDIQNIDQLQGHHFNVIGGNESAIDLATNLYLNGKEVNIYTDHTGLDSHVPDPSINLAPITKEHWQRANRYRQNIPVYTNHQLKFIDKTQETYRLTFTNGEQITSATPPLLATGFEPIIKRQFYHLFDFMPNGKPLLTAQDESTCAKNIFVIGPSVQHNQVIFCYIYKFRQRFLPIIETIAQREKYPLNPKIISWYQQNAMAMNELDPCCVNCHC